MGILTGLFEKRLEPSRNGLAALAQGGVLDTAAGVPVSQGNVLSLSAVFACVRLLAGSSAMLPLMVYERDGRGKRAAQDHPVYALLHDEPNPEMSDFDLRMTMMAHVLTWGNAYCEIEWGRDGYPRALWPLRPDGVTPRRVEGGDLVYDVLVPGDGVRRLPGYRVLHLHGLGYSGLSGYSMIRTHAETFGYSFATKLYGAFFFGNGARPGVVLKHPARLSEGAYTNLQKSFNAAHQGLDNSHRVRILEEGMDLSTVGVPPEEAQFLETQKYQVADIARIFGVPPHMIGDVERSTSWGSGIEQMSIGFAVYTLQPWLTSFEKRLRRSLLLPQERGRYFIEHKIDGLLRGDQKARYEAYNIGRNGGWLSVNDVRALENMNPIDGGDTYLQPLNMEPVADEADGERADPTVNRSQCDHDHERRAADEVRAEEFGALRVERQQLAAAYVGLFEDAIGRLAKRELADLGRAVEKYLVKSADFDGWRDWLISFYDSLRDAAPGYLRPAVIALASQAAASAAAELGEEIDPAALAGFVDDYVETYAGGYVASHHRQLKALTQETLDAGEDPAPVIGERLDHWAEHEARREGAGQAVEAMNALVIAAYMASGVTLLRWLSTGDSCPICDKLNNRVVGIEGYFVNAGETLGEGDQVMTFARARRHAPLHEGCDCTVMAVRA